MKQRQLKTKRNPLLQKQVSNDCNVRECGLDIYNPYSNLDSITKLKVVVGTVLFILLIGIIGGMEQNTINFSVGFILSLVILFALLMLARSVENENRN